VLEAKGIGFDESALALAAVGALPGEHRELAAQTLRHLVHSHGLASVADVLERACLNRRVPQPTLPE
jgi:hypothetical protein